MKIAFKERIQYRVSPSKKVTELWCEYISQVSSAHTSHNLQGSSKVMHRWRPPLTHSLKCNVDATFSDSMQIGALSAIILDTKGSFIKGSARRVPMASSRPTVALAIWDGLLLALSCSCREILVESNSLEVIEACRGNLHLWDIKAMMEDIVNLKKEFSFCAFLWTPREANSIMHFVAKMSLAGKLQSDRCISKAISLRCILANDCNQFGLCPTSGPGLNVYVFPPSLLVQPYFFL